MECDENESEEEEDFDELIPINKNGVDTKLKSAATMNGQQLMSKKTGKIFDSWSLRILYDSGDGKPSEMHHDFKKMVTL